MSPAGLPRLAGLVSVAAGVLLVVTQPAGALAFVVVDADPVRAGSALVGVNGPLTLLAVYLLVGPWLACTHGSRRPAGRWGWWAFWWRCWARCC
jgi:hypothetical protein